jgi:FxsC-like protein
MAYEFFLSYTRANNDAFLKRFYEELSQSIRDKRGLPAKAVVGYFDQKELELGEDWEPLLIEALQTSSVVIAVASPGYFKSEYCGKEWAFFRERMTFGLPAGSPVPPLIKPIIWIPFRTTDLPAAVRQAQYTFGDPAAVQNERGFKYLLKNLQAYEVVFNELIDALAQQIVDAADTHAVPRIAPVPPLKAVRSAFDTPVAPAEPSRRPTGPKHVRLVYVAADPNTFGTARVQDAYMDVGGADWKPFYPAETTRIHRLVQNFVANDDLDFTSEELQFSHDLIDDVEDAWQKRQIVVLIVDGWSLNWSAEYRRVLSQLDQRLDYHWCVLVPRNDQDADSAALRAQIDAAIGQTFDRHANLARNPMFYRDDIRSVADLKAALREVLTKLKEEIKKRAEVAMPVPAGPAKSVISGPASQSGQ